MKFEGDAADFAQFFRMLRDGDAEVLIETWKVNAKQILDDNPPPPKADGGEAKQVVNITGGQVHIGDRDESVKVATEKGSSAVVGDHNVQSVDYSEGGGSPPDIVAELAKLREAIASMGLDDKDSESICRAVEAATGEANAETPNRSMVSMYVRGALEAVKAVNAGVKFAENRDALKAAIIGIASWCGTHAAPILSLFQ